MTVKIENIEHYDKKIPKWKIGLYVWRIDEEWRLRLYRPWKKSRLIETQCADIVTALYVLGVGAGWWKQ